MPFYKLSYFPLKGLGEPIRHLLSFFEIDFEDNRFPREDWANIKPTTPFCKAPFLKIDGKQVHQSTAICRYLGREAWNCRKIKLDILSMICAQRLPLTGTELTKPLRPRKKKFWSMKLDLSIYPSSMVAKNNGGYLANKLSWEDLYFVGVSDDLYYTLNKNTRIWVKVKKNVVEATSIKAWMDKRPPSDF